MSEIYKELHTERQIEAEILAFPEDDQPGSNTDIVPNDTWPEPLADHAFHGIAGDIVRLIVPHTEADAAGLLIQFLVGFGNLVGRDYHFLAEADRHGTNTNLALVGRTAKGRKGTSWGYIRRVLNGIDEGWAGSRIQSGLSSGEGLVWEIRDPITRITKDDTVEIVDEGISDKRLFVVEPELSNALKVANREGNTLSGVVRNAWDTGDLQFLTKNSQARARGGHISILGHITQQELLKHLTSTEAANGFANRFLWACVRRSKLLPEGGNLDWSALDPLIERAKDAAGRARCGRDMCIRRDEEARAIWHSVYAALSEEKPGLLGCVIGRSEAQVMRLALIYAVLDESDVIRAAHLNAALAVWEYCEASARYIFGDALGYQMADDILDALKNSPEGMTRTQLRDYFGRNKRGDEIGGALSALQKLNLVHRRKEATGGAPAERWFAGANKQ
jgi:hypothetical protein